MIVSTAPQASGALYAGKDVTPGRLGDVRLLPAHERDRQLGIAKSRCRVEKIGNGFSLGPDTQPATNVAACCKQKVAVTS
jgi:hypothetical protein